MIRGKITAAAMSLLVTVVCAGGCGSDGGGVSAATPAERPAAVPVTVASVMRRDVPLKVRAIGNVEAYRTVSVRSQVDGQLAEVHFKEGGEVATGDLLFTIDPRPFEAALRAAEANLARDEAQRNNAEVEAKRLSRLLEQGFASADEADQVKTRAAAMNATVKADEAAVGEGIPYQFDHLRLYPKPKRLFGAGQRLLAFLEVYLPQQASSVDPQVSVRFTLKRGEETLLDETNRFRPRVSKPDTVDVLKVLPTEGLGPGSYQLEALVSQDGGSFSDLARLDFEVGPAQQSEGDHRQRSVAGHSKRKRRAVGHARHRTLDDGQPGAKRLRQR